MCGHMSLGMELMMFRFGEDVFFFFSHLLFAPGRNSTMVLSLGAVPRDNVGEVFLKLCGNGVYSPNLNSHHLA